ncbi:MULTISPECIES: hypothetical protein [Methanobacterium]|uniref:DUF8136 domain-containing protein n=1 Tax=Methanobacterium veterum TaxID=408577 RepID=A0A9E5A4U2_9EURY|nr:MULTISPECIES: hypothetical protein [Methanobacterium]MCZ3365395.1 hypothetical protein [Methanobacterium veterum]MCZ3373146.1 hypothetical protein [Methanobacterium veterum]
MDNEDKKDIDIETTRKELLVLIAETTKSLYEKYTCGRIRDLSNDRLRNQIADTFFKGCKTFNEILNNLEMEEMKEELARLREMYENEIKG